MPDAPSLSGSPATGKGVQLSWTTPSNGGSAITGYNVYRAQSSGGPWSLRTTLGVVNSFKDSSTTRGATYYYRVTAVNAAGEGSASNTVGVRAR